MREFTCSFLCDQIQIADQRDVSTTTPVQKIITSEKGVAIDFDSVSRDAKSQSKELYTWGQTEDDDLKDGAFHRSSSF
jgi:hypothetical protein